MGFLKRLLGHRHHSRESFRKLHMVEERPQQTRAPRFSVDAARNFSAQLLAKDKICLLQVENLSLSGIAFRFDSVPETAEVGDELLFRLTFSDAEIRAKARLVRVQERIFAARFIDHQPDLHRSLLKEFSPEIIAAHLYRVASQRLAPSFPPLTLWFTGKDSEIFFSLDSVGMAQGKLESLRFEARFLGMEIRWLDETLQMRAEAWDTATPTSWEPVSNELKDFLRRLLRALPEFTSEAEGYLPLD